MTFDTAVERTLVRTREAILAARNERGTWTGSLSLSPLSTATAIGALTQIDAGRHAAQIAESVGWLVENANDDGGFGDTIQSPSNLATTLLAWCAIRGLRDESLSSSCAETRLGIEGYLREHVGSLSPDAIAAALTKRYGGDRTFSAPILSFAALAGGLGDGPAAWKHVAALPFEFAALPHRVLRVLGLPVVSYALPALIAVGQSRHVHCPTRCPIRRPMRSGLRGVTLRKLVSVQPESGGFLEAAPLTSFVAMNLAGMGLAAHPVVKRCEAFLLATVRGRAWPIDTDLATWVTSLAIHALGDEFIKDGPDESFDAWRRTCRRHFLATQYKQPHPYTQTAPGGWAWTDRSGGVPDADDTAGALLSLFSLQPPEESPAEDVLDAVRAGVDWLLGLQNRDGGWPTFCRGWGKLPFDRSCSDLTAHVVRALHVWHANLPTRQADAAKKAIHAGLRYLREIARDDGSFVPLWFGNQHAADQENPVFGTGRVVCALAALREDYPETKSLLAGGVRYLLNVQQPDGGWGGDLGAPASLEETAVAVEAIAVACRHDCYDGHEVQRQLARGAGWLVLRSEEGRTFPAAPIGLYFASLWYHEAMYPLVFVAAALRAYRAVAGDVKKDDG